MSKLRITLAQINPTIGDIQSNIALMQRAAKQACQDQAQLVVFPELSLSGYYPGDLLDEPAFLDAIETGIENLLTATRHTPGLHWVIGTPTRRTGAGKPLQNSLLVLADGAIVLAYAKQLLPTYNVFDERRHFEPGPDVAKVLQINDTRVGFLICEDGWNDEGSAYAINPIKQLATANPDLVITINASPSNLGKREERHKLFCATSQRHHLPLLYVNQVGGQDQLVFDGASFAVTPDAGIAFEAEPFEESINTLEFEAHNFTAIRGSEEKISAPQALPKMEFYRRQIILGLRDYARRCGFSKVVVGSSGGIDSALTLALAVEALGADNVVGITMPSHFSSAGSVDDSITLCANLRISLLEHPIRTLVDNYRTGFETAFQAPLQGLTQENLQARIRGTILMEYSNAFCHLLLTTGNKSEISVGYCTLYGDTNGGLGLIGDLYKTEVFELCRHINARAGREIIPFAIIDKEPSAELAPGQRDLDSLPPYPVLDTILKQLIEEKQLIETERAEVNQAFQLLIDTPDGQTLVNRIKTLIARNEYKRRQAPPILRLRGRAFGNGRQMPIAAYYKF